MSIERDVKTGRTILGTFTDWSATPCLSSPSFSRTSSIWRRQKVGEKLQKLGGGLALIGAGAVLVIPALVMALFALSSALIGAGWSQPPAYLTSAVIAGAVSGALFAVGVGRLKAGNLVPRETIRQLEKDKKPRKEWPNERHLHRLLRQSNLGCLG